MKNYYYIDSYQKQQGPIEASQLLAHGCSLYTFVWTDGMSDWQQAKDVQELSYLFSTRGNNAIHSSQISDSSNRTFTSTNVEVHNKENRDAYSLTSTFIHLLYSILWFAAAGLVVCVLTWLLTESKSGRIKVVAFLLPLYCAWYGLKELGIFFIRLLKL